MLYMLFAIMGFQELWLLAMLSKNSRIQTTRLNSSVATSQAMLRLGQPSETPESRLSLLPPLSDLNIHCQTLSDLHIHGQTLSDLNIHCQTLSDLNIHCQTLSDQHRCSWMCPYCLLNNFEIKFSRYFDIF